ncbi:proton-conducting transporter transmembrane domain-containing protein [Blastococcus tunisiensis]|uniref:NADH:ubiquinone oxidoreductase subunit 5 (Chain L)/Multisubunit Na+/H+ antiporter, MnhA subunit n=1 Tax=Blastococcus tunisiensis TaxID=1798228 RepID=A0A1I2DR63_9ACTN|nr:proton-conducting transporter membrane subunit [Blastococcus sp. DSM 46838]SFE82761.1 NADH:ubiquinone oxidoreductase subunit 5 (chain L)/Multisubunit Na+/H+ antiporter, MnhA subunit [Blastococcus sp. DSM 46838]
MSAALLWSLVGLPAVVGALLCAAGRRADRAAPAVAVGTAVLLLGAAVAVAVQRPEVSVPFLPGADLGLAVDALSAVVLPAVAAVTLLVLVFSAGEIADARGRFFGLMLLFAAAVALTVTATTLPALLFAWEIMGATSYALIAFSWRDPDRVGAGTTAFLTTRAADVGLYVAAGAALAGGAGLGLAELQDAEGPWLDVVAAGVLVAALGKAAQLPFSFWLSRAMEGPSPVSALLHSAAMVAMGGYLLLRTAPLLEASGWAATTAAWVGALTAVALGAVALAQHDLKQTLAASTSAQLGYVVLGAGVGGVSGGAAHLVAHAATKALLFLVAGAWLSALGTKQLTALRGAARRWPLVGVLATVGTLSLAGVVPLSLWATKDDVLAVAKHSSVALYVVGLVGAALSAAYAAKVLWQMWGPLPADAERGYDTERQGTRRIELVQTAPMVVLAAGAAVLGLLVWPPVGEAIRRALGEVGAPRPGVVELVVSSVLAVGVVLAVRRWPHPEPAWAIHWLGLGAATQALVVRPVLRLAEALARFDDRVLDRSVTGAAVAVRGMASGFARFDDRVLDRGVESTAAGSVRVARGAAIADSAGFDGAAEGVAGAARRLGDLLRRTQTGQLHQYYVQAAVVLAAALALLLLTR